MEAIANMLTSFKKPNRTPEEWAAWDAEIAAEDESRRMNEIAKRIRAAHIPLEYAEASEIREEIAKWADGDPDKGLLMQGPSGRGKTYQAVCALKRMANEHRVLFTTFADIKHAAKDCFHGYIREHEVIAEYTLPHCLLIDDVGKEQMTAWSLPIFFEIIKKRGEKLRPTIITTNDTGKQLLSKFTIDGDRATADAILSRLSAYEIVKMNGEDRRRK